MLVTELEMGGWAGQPAAIIEGIITDAGDGIGDDDRGESEARIKGTIMDTSDGVGNGDVPVISAIPESTIPDAGDGVCCAIVCHGCRDCKTARKRGIVRRSIIIFYLVRYLCIAIHNVVVKRLSARGNSGEVVSLCGS